MEVVAGIVISTVAVATLTAVIDVRWSVQASRKRMGVRSMVLESGVLDRSESRTGRGLRLRCAWESAIARAHGEEEWQRPEARGFGRHSKRRCRSHERRHGRRRRSIAELLGCEMSEEAGGCKLVVCGVSKARKTWVMIRKRSWTRRVWDEMAGQERLSSALTAKPHHLFGGP